MHRVSFWIDSTPETQFARQRADMFAPVVVIGGGIVGVTTALELQRRGWQTALVEAHRVGHGASGYTTAKVTAGQRLAYSRLVRDADRSTAHAYASSQLEGLKTIVRLVDELHVDCDLERVPNLVFAETDDERQTLVAELEAARDAGLGMTLVDRPAVPFPAVAALRLDDQAQLHPLKYIHALATAFVEAGGVVLERTRVTEIAAGSPTRVTTEHGKLLAGNVVVATHVPIGAGRWLQVTVEPRRSYVVAAKLDDAPDVEGMWINVGSPTRSIRTAPHDGTRLVLVGGEGHRVGLDGPTSPRYEALERYLAQHFAAPEVTHRWSTQDPFTSDGLPIVGRVGGRHSSLFVATGFGGWGMTNGTVAAQLLADAVGGIPNRWAEMYDPHRLTHGRAVLRTTARTAVLLARRVQGRWHRHGPPEEPPAGGGHVVAIDGRDVALARSADGKLHAVSAVCTHMGCLVSWNDAERTWDCPCHGSRFEVDGMVIEGPATTPLEQIEARLPVYRTA